MKEKFKVPVGLSSHCNSVIDAIAAVVLGANMIEKHITYDKSLEHGDHKFALNAEELKQMVTSIRNVEKSIGKAKNGPSEGEKIETQWRRSIYAKVDIDVGEKLSEDNLMIVRPSPLGSLAPEYYEKVLGQQIKTSVKKGELITREMVDI